MELKRKEMENFRQKLAKNWTKSLKSEQEKHQKSQLFSNQHLKGCPIKPKSLKNDTQPLTKPIQNYTIEFIKFSH